MLGPEVCCMLTFFRFSSQFSQICQDCQVLSSSSSPVCFFLLLLLLSHWLFGHFFSSVGVKLTTMRLPLSLTSIGFAASTFFCAFSFSFVGLACAGASSLYFDTGGSGVILSYSTLAYFLGNIFLASRIGYLFLAF